MPCVVVQASPAQSFRLALRSPLLEVTVSLNVSLCIGYRRRKTVPYS